MGEKVAPAEGMLSDSRAKAKLYLGEGHTFALAHALDHRLGLGVDGFELAVSFCASQFLRDDLSKTRESEERIPKFRIFNPLTNLLSGNIRILELAEDYLSRTREDHIRENLSERPEEYPLAIRQAVQGLFVIERSRKILGGNEYQEEINNWGTTWKAQIQRSTGL